MNCAAEMEGRRVNSVRCQPVVLKVAPLQFADRQYSPKPNWYEKYGLAKFPEDMAAARQKLQNYYARLGFRQLRDTEWMMLNLSYQRRTLEEVGYKL